MFGLAGGMFTWERVKVIDRVHVFTVGVRSNEIELAEKLLLCGVTDVDNAQRVHLHVGRLRLPNSDVQLDGVSSVRLSVGDDYGHFAHVTAGTVEDLCGHAYGGPCEGALAHVRHVADRLFHVLFVIEGGQVELNFGLSWKHNRLISKHILKMFDQLSQTRKQLSYHICSSQLWI